MIYQYVKTIRNLLYDLKRCFIRRDEYNVTCTVQQIAFSYKMFFFFLYRKRIRTFKKVFENMFSTLYNSRE